MNLLAKIRKALTKKRSNTTKPTPAQVQQAETDRRLEKEHIINIQTIQDNSWTAESEFQ